MVNVKDCKSLNKSSSLFLICYKTFSLFMLPKKTMYTKLLGSLIKKGQKAKAKNLLDYSIKQVSTKLKMPISKVLIKLFFKLNRFVEIKHIRLRRNTHIVPFPLTSRRQKFLKVKLLKDSIKLDLRKVSFKEKLISEISNILLNRSSFSLRKKNLDLKESLKSRSNIHYRW